MLTHKGPELNPSRDAFSDRPDLASHRFGGEWFDGIVDGFSVTLGYRIVYADGDGEDLSAEDVESILVDGDTEAAA